MTPDPFPPVSLGSGRPYDEFQPGQARPSALRRARYRRRWQASCRRVPCPVRQRFGPVVWVCAWSVFCGALAAVLLALGARRIR